MTCFVSLLQERRRYAGEAGLGLALRCGSSAKLFGGATGDFDIEVGKAVFAVPAHAAGFSTLISTSRISLTGTRSVMVSLRLLPLRLLTNSLTVRAMRCVPVIAACSRSSLV